MPSRNVPLKANKCYVVRFETNDPERPSMYYRVFGTKSLETAIANHEAKGDKYRVHIGVSESPY